VVCAGELDHPAPLPHTEASPPPLWDRRQGRAGSPVDLLAPLGPMRPAYHCKAVGYAGQWLMQSTGHALRQRPQLVCSQGQITQQMPRPMLYGDCLLGLKTCYLSLGQEVSHSAVQNSQTGVQLQDSSCLRQAS